jgi:hypothetical protein
VTTGEPVVEEPACATWMISQEAAVHWVDVGKVELVYIPLVAAVRVRVVAAPELSST